MTGFAAASGHDLGHDWAWEIRSVNGKGLDLRLRMPEIEGLEAAARGMVAARAARGNIQLNLRLGRVDAGEGMRLSGPGLAAALAALAEVEARAAERGMVLAPTSAAEVISLRGVIEQGPVQAEDPGPLRTVLLTHLDRVLGEFVAMRRAEGAQIGAVIAAQLGRIEALTESAATIATARKDDWAAQMRANLARVMEGAPGADPDRVAQELALLAVKADVTEEVDRLRAHVAAARALLVEAAPIGRRFDFLTQELVREANTLCSKSGSSELTAIGLDLKQVIDQMREQIQNVE